MEALCDTMSKHDLLHVHVHYEAALTAPPHSLTKAVATSVAGTAMAVPHFLSLLITCNYSLIVGQWQ